MMVFSLRLLIPCLFCVLFAPVALCNRTDNLGEDALPCNLCPGSSREPNLPDKNVSSFFQYYLDAYEVDVRTSMNWTRIAGTCSQIYSNAQELLTFNSSECQAVQSVSGLCGCPVRRNSCNMECSILRNPQQIIDAPEYDIPVMSCEDLMLHATQFTSDSRDCTDMKSLLHDRCECYEPCTLCPDGSELDFLDKNVSSFLQYYLNERRSSMNWTGTTCSEIQSNARELLTFNSSDCQAVQSVSGLCGCPVRRNSCNMECSILRNPEQIVDTPEYDIPVMSCEDLMFHATQFTSDSGACTDMKSLFHEQCECYEPCTLCPDGRELDFPDKNVSSFLQYYAEDWPSIDWVGFTGTCSEIDQDSQRLLTVNSSECQAVQSVSGLCGCPERENACNIECSIYGNPERIVNAPEYGIPKMSCYDLALHATQFTSDSQDCSNMADLFYDQCNCLDDEDIIPCTLCQDGRDADLPDKNVSSFLQYYFEDRSFIDRMGLTGTCFEIHDKAQESLQFNDCACQAVQNLGGLCGCPVRRNSCSTLCSNLGAEEQIVEAPEHGLPPMSCEDLMLHATLFIAGSQDCSSIVDLFYDQCVCIDRTYPVFVDDPSPPGGDYTNKTQPPCRSPKYPLQDQDSLLSAEQKNKALAWIPRIAGILSALGSLYIIWDVWKGRRWQDLTVYQELMLSMSFFDIISSIAWAFSTLPIPKEDDNGGATGIYGARGNEATCTAQGFFKQLGFTGIWYNLTLSLYYLLVIRHSVREDRLRRFSRWFHSPSVIGIGLAFAGIPFYDFDVWACYIPPPPLSPNYWAISIFLIVPVSIVIVTATVNMLLVYLSVRSQDAIGEKWRFRSSASTQTSPNTSSVSSGTSDLNRRRSSQISSRQSQTMERAVFWQCFLYLGAFYLTWPILIVSQFMSEEGEAGFGFWATVFALAPAQGMWNLIVYVRPRLQQRMQRRRRERASQSSPKSSSKEQFSNSGNQATCHKTDTVVSSEPTVSHGEQNVLDTVHEDGDEQIEGVMGP